MQTAAVKIALAHARVADMFANTRRLGFDFEELFVEVRLRNKKLEIVVRPSSYLHVL